MVVFWLSTHDCQVPDPKSQTLEVEQQIWIFGITKSRISNGSWRSPNDDTGRFLPAQPITALDFRCDDEKKTLELGDILVLLCSWRLQDFKTAGH